MKKIKFEDLPSENTPINSANLDTLQNNIEESAVIVSSTEPQTKEKVWLQKGYNILNLSDMPKSINGITTNETADGSIVFNGTPNKSYIGFIQKNIDNILENGAYILYQNNYDDKIYQSVIAENKSTHKKAYYTNNKSSQIIQVDKNIYTYTYQVDGGTTSAIGTLSNYKKQFSLITGDVEKPYQKYITNKILTKTNGVFEEFYNEETVVKDTGWINIPLLPEFSNYAEWIPCQIRKIDNVVHLRGAVKGFTKINYTKFATIPEGFRPNENEQHVQNLLNSVKNLAILTVARNGNLEFTEIQYQPRNTEGILINCTWFTD